MPGSLCLLFDEVPGQARQDKNRLEIINASQVNSNMKEHNYFVYIMSNKHNTVFYTGYTDDLERRVWQHKTAEDWSSFTARYNICKLVYFEEHEYVLNAIQRENSIKRWQRAWKINLIKANNPEFEDLAVSWYEEMPD